LHVTSPAGTDVVAEFLPAYRWIASDGNIIPGKWMNLPTGETYTCPINVNGVAVIDGVLGDHFDRKYGALAATPVRLHVVNGVVTEISCSNQELERELKKYMDSDPRGRQIGEFGIGTNIGLEGVVGNMLLDEKHPGVHLAVGDPYGSKTGAPWKSDVHCDGVLLKTTIVADGEVIMREGKFDEKYTK
jgi:leucyl aminopeptidase (aminopeptidase T)